MVAWLLVACVEPGLDPFTVAPVEGEWRVDVAAVDDTCGAVPEDAPLAPVVGSLFVEPRGRTPLAVGF